MKFAFLNTKERKKLMDKLKAQYDLNELKLDYIFIKNKDNKIYLLSRKFIELDNSKIKIDSFGMYFARIFPDGIRLSVEGSQIVGPLAKKNVADVDNKQINGWIRGDNMKIDEKFTGYIIVRYNNDFFGAGRFKDGEVLNSISRERRIKVL